MSPKQTSKQEIHMHADLQQITILPWIYQRDLKPTNFSQPPLDIPLSTDHMHKLF